MTIFLLLTAWGSSFALALAPKNQSSANLQGFVFHADSKKPLAYAEITLEGTSIGTTTGKQGWFSFPTLSTGKFTISVHHVGFRTKKIAVSLSAGEGRILEIPMEVTPIAISEIVTMRESLTGQGRRLQTIPGSAQFIGPEELAVHHYNDIHRVLRSVPGVNLQEEDGFGLRPNIGMRGTGVERSQKITIMEDGVLIAPAPYAAPSAYYFPTTGRMQGIEVRKGSSQIKYGPFTTGGALNLISSQIPRRLQGSAKAIGGAHGSRNLQVRVGDSRSHFGFLLEGYHGASDGFKELDNGGGTGFDKTDFMGKFRLNSAVGARVYQEILFKIGRTDELSDETYLGLTDEDFLQTPLRRYAASQQDQMKSDHRQYNLRYFIRPAKFIDLSVTAYRNEFSRNWYKLDKLRVADGEKVSIAPTVDHPAEHRLEYQVLTGSDAGAVNALDVKANNRDYLSTGLQSIMTSAFSSGSLEHQIEWGVRYHQDEMDRFQWVDVYQMHDAKMTLVSAGIPGTESNRIESANVFATFLQYQVRRNRLTIMPGLRFEGISLQRKDYGKADTERLGVDLTERKNDVSVWIPGFGISYQANDNLVTFAGIHRGFSPPGSAEGTQPEKSWNYEAGFQSQIKRISSETTVFYNHYDNLLGSDLAATGGSGSGDLFNGGAAVSYGVEFSASYDLAFLSRLKVGIPLRLAYTYAHSEFRSTFESDFESWGTVASGDQLPYVPSQQLFISSGFLRGNWLLEITGKYNGRMRTIAGQGPIPQGTGTDAYWVIDASVEYAARKWLSLYINGRNLGDEIYVAARRPAGIRPGLPRSLLAGLSMRF